MFNPSEWKKQLSKSRPRGELVKHGPGRPYEDLTGLVFGRWTVLSIYSRKSGRQIVWNCVCRCGSFGKVAGGDLKSTTSGGCRDCRHRRMKKFANSRMWVRLKRGAIKRGYLFTIDRERTFELLNAQQHKCAITGLPIQIAVGAKAFIRGESTASLDRIDNSLGYEQGNVWWVHKDVNKMKGALSLKRFIRICKLVAEINQ